MFSVSQTGTFEAAHCIKTPGSPEWYKTMHGHSFQVTVECSAEELPETGWVVDFRKLDLALKDVLGTLDHKVLNDIEGLEKSTLENILQYIDRELLARDITASRIDIARPTLGQTARYVPSR
ncbi:6-carboxytetrahydropterin synthase [Parvularcula sp. LCG005]|uniref:6-pyruvoyl trahydropterin synthase family protein n=1 Tax=Parvularcula sp. LCG005 TaxID=3078805 RepID=UPI002941C817|nr:6-carboxytetrahydropterin synthase [Parvularcula sp. LCG005]WOI54713.1 6-carboxytetrahydropterin synthase [Parvularcula sp. LCG005]